MVMAKILDTTVNHFTARTGSQRFVHSCLEASGRCAHKKVGKGEGTYKGAVLELRSVTLHL